MDIHINQKKIKDLCGAISFKKGQTFYQSGKVNIEELTEMFCQATVTSTEDFHVRIEQNGAKSFQASCSCPSLSGFNKSCQHVAAGGRQSVLFKRSEDVILNGGVHVAAQNHRHEFLLWADGINDAADELHGLASCYFAHVVKMCVEIVDVLIVSLVLQASVGQRSFAGCVPAFGNGLGRFAQPEGASFYQFEVFFLVENGHAFAFVLAIVAADTHHAVFFEVLAKILLLVG